MSKPFCTTFASIARSLVIAVTLLTFAGSFTTAICAQEAAPSTPAIVAQPDVETPLVKLGPYEPDIPWDALKIGEFSLVDQLGRPVTPESLRGKPWVANFIFSRCVIECPQLMGKAYYNLHQRLKDVDFRIVTITVDPKFDDVARMKKQSDVFSVDPDRWLFVTGPVDSVYDLIRNGFKQGAWAQVNAGAGMEFAHSLNMIHVDKDGVITGKYNGHSDEELETLAQVLEGKIKTPRKHSPVAITTSPPVVFTDRAAVPGWLERLPGTNAMLNTLATMLLLGGYSAIRAGQSVRASDPVAWQNYVRLHKKLMLTAFATSIVFLASYLTYHFGLDYYTGRSSKPFQGQGWIRPVYFSILITHVVLAALVPFGALATIYYAYREKWDRHRRMAKVTYPIWLYVSITGVVIYGMLYHLPM